MSETGDFLLFSTGRVRFALPLEAVIRLEGGWTGEAPEPVAGRPPGPEPGAAAAEGVAVVQGRGLTLKVPMDRIFGNERAADVRAHPVPPLLSPCRWLAGLVEAREELFLLFDPRTAAGAPGGLAVSAGAAAGGPKAQEDTGQ